MEVKGVHMKKIFLLLICLFTIGAVVFSNSLIVYASDNETDIALASTDRLFSYFILVPRCFKLWNFYITFINLIKTFSKEIMKLF